MPDHRGDLATRRILGCVPLCEALRSRTGQTPLQMRRASHGTPFAHSSMVRPITRLLAEATRIEARFEGFSQRTYIGDLSSAESDLR